MLVEITVHNIAVIEETRLVFGPGFNVITGETGAGKSLLVDALEFVLGGAADRDLMRLGASSMSVEAVFSTIDDAQARETFEALEVEIDDEGLVVLFRETHKEGRTISRLNGRAVPVSVVRAVGAALVDIHGQGSHLSLLEPRFQLHMLDDFGGLTGQRLDLEKAAAAVKRLRDDLRGAISSTHEAEQQRDLLAFQLNEIESANLAEGEEEALLRERALLQHAEAILEACALACEVLYDGEKSATDLAAEAVHHLRRAPDPAGVLTTQVDAIESASAQLADAVREIRAFADGIESNPERLAEVDARVELLNLLKRKYGGSEAAVLAFAEDARARLEAIENQDSRREELERALAEASDQAGTLAWALSEARVEAAQALALASEVELQEVGLGRVALRVEVSRDIDDDGLPAPDGARYAFSSDGIDRVTFTVRTNLGEEAKPLARVASGGETSRMMLALKSALRARSGAPALIFDEIDAGIGGRAGEVVGRKLWAVAEHAQVLCVTHLPQIAAYADVHFRVGKSVLGERTYAGAEALGEGERVTEIAEMLGGESASLAQAAREMLDSAAEVKAGRSGS